MTKRYNHVFSLAFQFVTTDADGDLSERDATAVRTAILRRLASMGDAELIEAIGPPDNTIEEQPDKERT